MGFVEAAGIPIGCCDGILHLPKCGSGRMLKTGLLRLTVKASSEAVLEITIHLDLNFESLQRDLSLYQIPATTTLGVTMLEGLQENHLQETLRAPLTRPSASKLGMEIY